MLNFSPCLHIGSHAYLLHVHLRAYTYVCKRHAHQSHIVVTVKLLTVGNPVVTVTQLIFGSFSLYATFRFVRLRKDFISLIVALVRFSLMQLLLYMWNEFQPNSISN